MTINELIKKYEEIIKTYYEWFKPNSKIKQLVCNEDELNCYKEILQDLNQLKEKIIKRQFTKSYISTNQDNSLMAVESMINEIIGE